MNTPLGIAVQAGSRARRLAMSGVALTVGTSLGLQGLAVISGVVSSRLLGPSGRGDLASVLAWGTAFAALGELGLQNSCAKLASSHPHKRQATLGSALAVAAVSALTFTLLASAAIWIFVPEHLTLTALAFTGIIVPSAILRTPLAGMLRGTERYFEFNVARVLVVLPYTFWLGALLFVPNADLRWLLATNAAGYVMAFLYTGLVVLRQLRPGRPTREAIREHLRFGLVSHLGTLSSSETLRLDLLLMAILANSFTIGIYAAATSLMSLPRLVGQSVGIVALTDQARTSSSPGKIQPAIMRFRQTTVLTLPIALGLALISPILLPLAFGNDFANASFAAGLMAIGGGILSLRRVLADSLRGAGHQRISTSCEVLSIVILLVSLPPLLRYLDITGAGLAFLLSNFVSFLLLIPLTSRTLDIPLMSLRPTRSDFLLRRQRI